MSEAKPALEAEAPKKLNLAQKILAIQDAVGVVNKKGKFDSAMGGGNYLRIEDAVVAVNKLLCSKGLIFYGNLLKADRVPHERVGKDGNLSRSGYISSVLMEWTVEDTESGEKRSWQFPGDGYDSTDKSIYKSMTGSRKYAIICIFNLPIGNDVEEHGSVTFEEGKEKQKKIAANKVAEAAARGVPSAIDAMSQAEPEKKVTIARPEEYNGHYIIVSGYTAIPQLETFFVDTGCKRIDSKKTGKTGWKVPAEYEKGLLGMCTRLGLEIEG